MKLILFYLESFWKNDINYDFEVRNVARKPFFKTLSKIHFNYKFNIVIHFAIHTIV